MKLINNNLVKILVNLPYSYLWSYRSAIGKVNTILDLGTDDGKFMKDISYGKKWIIEGIEIYKPSFNAAKKKRIYKKLYLGDVEKVSKKLIDQESRYDVVLCSQVLEHLDKDKGRNLLKLAEKMATKRVVFALPISYMNQPEEFLKGNPYQKHKSGWTVAEFKRLEYKVYGVGMKLFWSEKGINRLVSNRFRMIFTFVSYIFSPLCYYFPRLASGMIAVKKL